MVKTGNKDNAGTSARVYITLHGANASTAEIQLDNPNRNDFERNQLDDFEVNAADVGDLVGFRIRHDNSKRKPGWYLKRITIVRGADGRTWGKDCSTWLAKTTGDGKIDRTFDLIRQDVGGTTFGAAVAYLYPNTAQSVYIPSHARDIVIGLEQGATAAAMTHLHQGFVVGLLSGNHRLSQGGHYGFSVGSWYHGPNQNPKARLTYVKVL